MAGRPWQCRPGVVGSPAPMRRLSPLDRLVGRADAVLRTTTRTGLRQQRPYPAAGVGDTASLDAAARRHAAGLMRVNHAGEVCAQALYVGQALLARNARTEAALAQAAREEGDHLFWCEQRLAELDAHPSRLNPAWFAGALAIGAAAALAGDRVSLGFVEETERQVVKHLDGHLEALPADDQRSRAVVRAMREDEARHAGDAAARGARRLPRVVR
ncbi:MAG: 2-polyprenyl-3-methyl-6-methoxy-1,4-benzoquinone monooxygenase, partial [Gammaproteobacteria bacterium]